MILFITMDIAYSQAARPIYGNLEEAMYTVT